MLLLTVTVCKKLYAIVVSLHLTAFSLNKCIKNIWFENGHIGILMVFLFKKHTDAFTINGYLRYDSRLGRELPQSHA